MFRLLPREEKFFDLFEQQAGHIVSASRVLEELTLDYPDAKAKAERIKDIEHAGDTLTHEIVRRLNTTFVTPIDREDIYAMASRLDDVLDLIDAVADRLFEIYDALSDQQLKREIIQAVSIGDSVNERVIKRLITIAKSGNDADLQRAAVRRLGGERGDDQLDALIEIYDGVNVDGVREEVINRLARSSSRKASDKLLKIAKDEPNPRLRHSSRTSSARESSCSGAAPIPWSIGSSA